MLYSLQVEQKEKATETNIFGTKCLLALGVEILGKKVEQNLEAFKKAFNDYIFANYSSADFVYAKNWSAYMDPNYGKILSKDMSWTVGERQMAVTNNAHFMHCLPVRRNMIVTDDVIESPRSLVIPEAANREISATVVLKRMLEALK
mgnify:CR=1 FL=1